MIRLETFIRDAFIKKEHVVAVFFDLEKAYDTSWRYGILRDLHELGLKGRLPVFIKSFLADRRKQVRVGSTLSDQFEQAQGVPQGSILSTTLFNIKINNIVNCLDPKTEGSLYVDDFCICYRSKSMRTVERHLQQCLNKIENWALYNGFKFSKSKTQCVHFSQLRKLHDNPQLYLYGSFIPVVDEAKILGVIFDRKLSFIPHIKYLKAKCLKALNLLKSSIAYQLGRRPYCPPTSLLVFNSVKVRLRSHCLWICSKVLLSNVRYSTPSRTSTGFGSLSNIACRKSIRGS